MAMNVKGIRKRLEELVNGLEETVEAKDNAISTAEDNEDDERVDLLDAIQETSDNFESEWEDAE